jgi:hypothetical protein
MSTSSSSRDFGPYSRDVRSGLIDRGKSHNNPISPGASTAMKGTIIAVAALAAAIMSAAPASADDPEAGSSCVGADLNKTATTSAGTTVRCLATEQGGFSWMVDTGAAFSDLGLDPHVLLPSQLTDPPTGQPATPPLPVPYPRTGQGGEPRLTLPDAITGNPGDPRYPYREPPPAPPPGGPPPGPPAPAPPGLASVPEPTPSPVYVPAPGEVPPRGGGQ